MQEAFAGESQANRRYLAFAKKAEAETVHAHAHLEALGGVKGTAENLQAAIDGEAAEFREMYPGFLEEARAAGERAAVRSFANALAVEEIHHGLYSGALEALKGGKDLPGAPIFVCGVCGNTVAEAPDRCPVCGAVKAKFSEIA